MAAHASARAFVRVPPKDVGMRLDRWLRSRLPQVTQAHLCRLVRKKMVRLAVKDQVGELARAPSTLAPTWRHLSTDIGSRIEAGMFVSLPAELSASLESHTLNAATSRPSSATSNTHRAPAAIDFGQPVDDSPPAGPASVSAHRKNLSQQQQRSHNATLSEAEQERLRGLVLYADRHVIALNKPAKLPVQGGLGVHRALTDWLHYLRDHPDTTTSHVSFHAGDGDSLATPHDGGDGAATPAASLATAAAAAISVRKARTSSAALPHLPTIAGSAHSVRSFASMSGIGAGSGPFAAFADESGGDGAKKRGGKKLSQSARLVQSLSDDELRLFSDGVLSKKKKRIAHNENMAAAASSRRRPAAGAAAAISLDEFGRPEGEVDATSTTASTGVVAKPLFARLSATAAVITSAAAAAVPVVARGASPSAAAHAIVDLDSPAEDDRLEVPRLVHRLDAETSGVLLLARSRRAAQRFTDMFRTHAYEKVYWALTEGAPRPAEGTIDRALSILPSLPNQHGDDEQHQQHSGGDAAIADADLPTQSAVTAYRTLATANVNSSSSSSAASASASACALLELRPKTGRKHQLRRHAVTDLQCPIVGDKKHAAAAALASDAHRDRRAAVYRALDVADPTLHLHARSIRFRHPFAGDKALLGDGASGGRGGAIVEIVAPPPPHMLRSFRKLKFDTVIDL